MTTIKEQLEWFKDHELILLTDSAVSYNKANSDTYKVTSYLLKKPGARNCSCQITFSPEGIAIQGDITPEDNNGSCSQGKGLEWFAGELSPGYLASKFLRRKWSEELCEQGLKRRIKGAQEHYEFLQANDSEHQEYTLERLEQLQELLKVVDCGEYEFTKAYEEAGYGDCGDDVFPGWGYDPQEVAILAAIQQTFRRLYWEREGAE